MNAANPYESPSTTSESRSWRPIEFFVVGLWLAIPIGVFAGQQLLLPVFEDFGVELPAATKYLLHFYSPYLVAIVSVVVLLLMFIIPNGITRRRFMGFACISGVLTGVVCSLTMLVPWFSLQQALS
ncbi:hypothetical protein [Planctomycetes bacterium K23_9]|uniref:Uncharacterized protein n=1 Tax=Stieleria marina TaxID=1930275 RepID=A0A517NM73_9BACT|nr:hypothetical protein K239x_01670 [Planctomycetes bacterium K23_9]